ncbi:MAG: hypothetical protein JSR73_05095 [Proteobacteria bacterium]|nr:hypothetical protein [Pseudomonadota bacterium]
MSAARAGEPGRTRTCPHCKATILDSADVCPQCQHHLRFGAASQAGRQSEAVFRLEGTVANETGGGVWEYDLVVALYDARGAQLARQVVHVGALPPGDVRRCLVSLDVRPADAPRAVAEVSVPRRTPPRPPAPSRTVRTGPPPAPGKGR